MSDGVWECSSSNGQLLASVHYFVYMKGQLPGYPEDLYLRAESKGTLERLLALPPDAVLTVEDEVITAGNFRSEVLPKVRHIGLGYDPRDVIENPNFAGRRETIH